MKSSSFRWVGLLVVINAVLIVALVASYTGQPVAQAQARSGGDYLLAPGNIRSDEQVVWIMDLGNSRMATCIYNRSRRNIEFGQIIDIVRQGNQPLAP